MLIDPAGIVLAHGRRHLQAGADDQVLFPTGEFLQRQRRRPVEVVRQPERGPGETVDDPFHGFTLVFGRSGQPGVRHDRVELARLSPQVEHRCVRQNGVRRIEVRIGDRHRRIERQTAARVDVARDQEIDADRGIGIGARLDVLRARRRHDPHEHAGGEHHHASRTEPNRTHSNLSNVPPIHRLSAVALLGVAPSQSESSRVPPSAAGVSRMGCTPNDPPSPCGSGICASARSSGNS